jgi:uncharacterized protein YfaS (alpha-2-macroglobulin family)
VLALAHAAAQLPAPDGKTPIIVADRSRVATAWPEAAPLAIAPETRDLSLTTSGNGPVYYAVLAPADPSGPTELKVRRRYLDASDKPVDATHRPRVGQLVRVELELRVGAVRSPLLIRDPLPAGLSFVSAESGVVAWERYDGVGLTAPGAPSETLRLRYWARASAAGSYRAPRTEVTAGSQRAMGEVTVVELAP